MGRTILLSFWTCGSTHLLFIFIITLVDKYVTLVLNFAIIFVEMKRKIIFICFSSFFLSANRQTSYRHRTRRPIIAFQHLNGSNISSREFLYQHGNRNRQKCGPRWDGNNYKHSSHAGYSQYMITCLLYAFHENTCLNKFCGT